MKKLINSIFMVLVLSFGINFNILAKTTDSIDSNKQLREYTELLITHGFLADTPEGTFGLMVDENSDTLIKITNLSKYENGVMVLTFDYKDNICNFVFDLKSTYTDLICDRDELSYPSAIYLIEIDRLPVE